MGMYDPLPCKHGYLDWCSPCTEAVFGPLPDPHAACRAEADALRARAEDVGAELGLALEAVAAERARAERAERLHAMERGRAHAG